MFTNQWLNENGATAFLRAAQSGDLELLKLLVARGADPKINTRLGVTPLAVAAGIGWVESVTREHSTAETVEAVKYLLSLGIDPNFQADTGRVALHGAAHKGATEVVKVLVAAGAGMDVRDFGNTDNRGSPRCPPTPGCRSTTPTVWCALACSRRFRIRKPPRCCAS